MPATVRSPRTVSTEPGPQIVRSRRDRAVARLAARARWYQGLAEIYQRQLGSCRRASARMTAAVRSFQADVAWLKGEVAERDARIARLEATVAAQREEQAARETELRALRLRSS